MSYEDYCLNEMRQPNLFRLDWSLIENITWTCAKWSMISAVILGMIQLVITIQGV